MATPRTQPITNKPTSFPHSKSSQIFFHRQSNKMSEEDMMLESEFNFRASIPHAFAGFLDEEENKICADCNQPNPDWCSLGFGVLICLECAGVHRSLGVHITLVKSLVLDQWEERQYLYIKQGGNKKFATYLKSILDSNGEQYVFKSLVEKYKHRDVLYYKEILDAAVENREERTIDHPVVLNLYSAVQQGSSKSSSESPKWVEDRKASSCMICKTDFSILRRRHHCRRCGKIVCNDCAPHKNTRPIPEWGFKDPVRHCKSCFRSPAIQWDK